MFLYSSVLVQTAPYSPLQFRTDIKQTKINFKNCLFVCLLGGGDHHYRWRAANFDLSSIVKGCLKIKISYRGYMIHEMLEVNEMF